MAFSDLDFQERLATMGDAAEGVFERVYPNGWVRFGLNRPPIKVSKLPPRVRYAPDYLTSKGFAECQGFGRDQIVKVKPDKLDALLWWHKEMFKTDLFLYDSHLQVYGWVPLPTIEYLVDSDRAELRRFSSDDVEYYAIPAIELTAVGVEWQEVPQ